MSPLETARQNLRDLLQDATALKVFVDPGKPDEDPFNSAFAAAMKKATAAALEYREVLLMT